jgi:hypothetical protein
MNHKQKVKMARKMITRDELKRKVPIFMSKEWYKRKERIEERIKK